MHRSNESHLHVCLYEIYGTNVPRETFTWIRRIYCIIGDINLIYAPRLQRLMSQSARTQLVAVAYFRIYAALWIRRITWFLNCAEKKKKTKQKTDTAQTLSSSLLYEYPRR
jgi:hypothetical protein